MTSMVILLVAAALVASIVVAWYAARLYAQQERAAGRIDGMRKSIDAATAVTKALVKEMQDLEKELAAAPPPPPAPRPAPAPAPRPTPASTQQPAPPSAAAPQPAPVPAPQPAAAPAPAPQPEPQTQPAPSPAPAPAPAQPERPARAEKPARPTPAPAPVVASSPAPQRPRPPFKRAAPSGQMQTGLAAGSLVPDFELIDIDGNRFRRSLLVGKRSVLLFLDVDNAGSKAIVEALRPQGSKMRALPKLVYIINGGPTVSQVRGFLGKLPRQATVLLQEETELVTVLRVGGTPSAFVLDDECVTQGGLRAGAVAVLEALGFAAGSMPAAARKATGMVPHGMVGPRQLRGLGHGVAAPALTLPRVGGGEVSLGGATGRRQLVIFMDPDCPPCEDYLPALRNDSAGWGAFDAVVVTRGDGAELAGLSLPVARQTYREAAYALEVLETPAAVEISAEGNVIGGPAIGAAAIGSVAARLAQGA